MSRNRTRLLRLFLAAVMLLGVPALLAQEPAEANQETEAATTEDEAPADAALQDLEGILQDDAVDTFRYDPQGRRDPFRSLIGPARQNVDRGDAPPGVPGFLIDELDLQGIVRTSHGYVATVKGPDNLGYTLRAGDILYDGEVLRITADAVYFRQEVNDPTRIERQREVVKQLERGSQATRR